MEFYVFSAVSLCVSSFALSLFSSRLLQHFTEFSIASVLDSFLSRVAFLIHSFDYCDNRLVLTLDEISEGTGFPSYRNRKQTIVYLQCCPCHCHVLDMCLHNSLRFFPADTISSHDCLPQYPPLSYFESQFHSSVYDSSSTHPSQSELGSCKEMQ